MTTGKWGHVCIYRGLTFRSRLEARWAMVFDELGLSFEYEPKAFETPAGWYLPDFHLPDLGLWVEIKPKAPDVDEEIKFQSLAKQHASYALLLAGLPREKALPSGGSTWTDASVWIATPSGSMAAISAMDALSEIERMSRGWSARIRAALSVTWGRRAHTRWVRFGDMLPHKLQEVFDGDQERAPQRGLGS